MLPLFQPASDYVPTDLDASTWEGLGALYRGLIERELHCVRCLERLIRDRSELDAAAQEGAASLSIRMTCHTDDTDASSAYLRHVQQVQPRRREAGFALDRKIVDSKFAGELSANRYGVMLRNLGSDVGLFRPENVALETQQATLDQEHQTITGGMTVEFDGAERTLAYMARYQEDTDRSVRERAWRSVAERRARDAHRLEAIFERLIDLRRESATNAGFASYRDYMFAVRRRFEYTPETCHEFARAVEKHVVPLLARLGERRRRRLGVSELRPWDTGVDELGRPALRPFATAQQLIGGCGRMIRRLDADLGAMFDELAADRSSGGIGCMDLESRKGKAPGGYQENRERLRLPFIFMNAAGTNRDVLVLVHEAGHAFHSLLCRSEPVLHYRSEIPIEFCEVASTAMEFLVQPHMTEFYPAADAQRARELQRERALAQLASVAMVDQYQHWLYTGTPTRREREEQWFSLMRRFSPWVDWTGLEEDARRSWQQILHLFSVPLYYIEYGIAGLGAAELWLNHRRDPAGAMAAYKRALAAGGSRPLPLLFEAAGLTFDFGESKVQRMVGAIGAELGVEPGAERAAALN